MNITPTRFCGLIPWLLIMALTPGAALAAEKKSAQSASSAPATADSNAYTALGLVTVGALVTAGLGMAVVNTADATLGDTLSKLQPANKLESYNSKRNPDEWVSFKCDTVRIIYTGHFASEVTGCKAMFLLDAHNRGDDSLKGQFMPAMKAENCDEARKICDGIDLKVTEAADGKISIHQKDKVVGIVDFSTPTISFQSK